MKGDYILNQIFSIRHDLSIDFNYYTKLGKRAKGLTENVLIIEKYRASTEGEGTEREFITLYNRKSCVIVCWWTVKWRIKII